MPPPPLYWFYLVSTQEDAPMTERLCVDEGLVALAQALVSRLKQLNLTIVTAESCTGGLIAALLSYAPGASDCLQGGFVAYTKHQKTTALEVSARLIADGGSVSADIAYQMAKGALSHSDAMIGLAVTGVLGPDPDEDGNRPGLVYFAAGLRSGEVRVVKEQFTDGEPDRVRRQVITRAFALVEEVATA